MGWARLGCCDLMVKRGPFSVSVTSLASDRDKSGRQAHKKHNDWVPNPRFVSITSRTFGPRANNLQTLKKCSSQHIVDITKPFEMSTHLHQLASKPDEGVMTKINHVTTSPRNDKRSHKVTKAASSTGGHWRFQRFQRQSEALAIGKSHDSVTCLFRWRKKCLSIRSSILNDSNLNKVIWKSHGKSWRAPKTPSFWPAWRIVLSLNPVFAVNPWKTRCGFASRLIFQLIFMHVLFTIARSMSLWGTSDIGGGFSAKSWRSTTFDRPLH